MYRILRNDFESNIFFSFLPTRLGQLKYITESRKAKNEQINHGIYVFMAIHEVQTSRSWKPLSEAFVLSPPVDYFKGRFNDYFNSTGTKRGFSVTSPSLLSPS